MILVFHIARVVVLILGPVVIPSAILAWAVLSDRAIGADQR
jgi:hypothetical protein